MRKPLFYMAHPVSIDALTREKGTHNFLPNVTRAKKWLTWFLENDRTRVYIAPWITEVELSAKGKHHITYGDALSDDLCVVEHCDGIILVGGMISNGMKMELDRAVISNKKVINWSEFRLPFTGIESRIAAATLRSL
jgi:hypothetical protein